MNKIKTNQILNKILFIFLIIQPLFDLKFIYGSVSSLIRVILILSLFLYYFFTSNNKKKYYLLIYPGILTVYFIFHHINALNFHSITTGMLNYSCPKEVVYFLNILSPFMLIYSIYKAKFSKETLLQILNILVIIISSIIIISNLFMFSFGSYTDELINANFFKWFMPNSSYTYQNLASKGLFENAYQISAVLTILLPFIICGTLKNNKFYNWIALILSIFALILLCTKISVLGVIIVISYCTFAFIFEFIKSKKITSEETSLVTSNGFNKKNLLKFSIIILIYIMLLPFNPLFDKTEEKINISSFDDNEIEQKSEIENDINSNSETQIETDSSISIDVSVKGKKILKNLKNDDMTSYIEANYQNKQINEQILFENYPYINDSVFWYNMLQKDTSLTSNPVYVEKCIAKRITEINNISFDRWLGLTHTRIENVLKNTRDFVFQYYSLGIIGLILVFIPYLVLLVIVIQKREKVLDIVNLISTITIIFAFCIAYFTGNLLNSLGFIVYLAIIYSFIIQKK